MAIRRHRRILYLVALGGSAAFVVAGLVLGPWFGETSRENAAGIGRTFGPGEIVELTEGDHRMDPDRAVYRYNPGGRPVMVRCSGLDEGPGRRPYRTRDGCEHIGSLTTYQSAQVRCTAPPGTRFAVGNKTSDLDEDFGRYLVTGICLFVAVLNLAICLPVLFFTERRAKRTSMPQPERPAGYGP
ncbi:hypothetical protein [Spirillospora sp. NPDC029432]|uniref:hypothetical protein n=1 Tax=Spirillospora sp. NPDC029432 TaxID=3154599 RepID=UPI00345348AA